MLGQRLDVYCVFEHARLPIPWKPGTEYWFLKHKVNLDDICSTISDFLNTISDILRERAGVHQNQLVHEFPGLTKSNSQWELNEKLDEGIVYVFPFDGNDADAEILEKATGLTLLGDCDKDYEESLPCVITGNLTTRKQHLARMY